MNADPWTNADPQPGDFDAELATLDPRYVEHREGDPNSTALILVAVEGESATRLERIADTRGQTHASVIADLLPAAGRSPA